jgi:hypothetical protein
VAYLYLDNFVVFVCFLLSPAFFKLILYQIAVNHNVKVFMFASVPSVLLYFNSHKYLLFPMPSCKDSRLNNNSLSGQIPESLTNISTLQVL